MCATAVEALSLAQSAGPGDTVRSDGWPCHLLGIVIKLVWSLTRRRPKESWRDCSNRLERWLVSTKTLHALPDVKVILCFRLFDAHSHGLSTSIEKGELRTARFHAAEMFRPTLEAEAAVGKQLITPAVAELVDPNSSGATDLESAIAGHCLQVS